MTPAQRLYIRCLSLLDQADAYAGDGRQDLADLCLARHQALIEAAMLCQDEITIAAPVREDKP